MEHLYRQCDWEWAYPHLSAQVEEGTCPSNLGLLYVSGLVVDIDIRSPVICCFLERRYTGLDCPCLLIVVGPSSGDKGCFPRATEIWVSSYITSNSYNDLPGPATTSPRGTLIVSGGKVDSCVRHFFFLALFEPASFTVLVKGTTEAISAAEPHCRV